MSDDTLPSSETSLPSIPENLPPTARQVSNPRPKKVAKKTAKPRSISPRDPIHENSEQVFDSSVSSHTIEPEKILETSISTSSDWPEPDAASVGVDSDTAGSNKRKRRRRKGKGQSSTIVNTLPAATEELPSIPFPETKSVDESVEHRPRLNPNPPQPHRPKIDFELLTKMAWKIYLAEVSEEGVALIGDADAKDLSRRCFRLAEIFIEEQFRRR